MNDKIFFKPDEVTNLPPIAGYRLLVECDKCHSTTFRDVVIHEGHSLRRDCAKCGRFMGWPAWHERKPIVEAIKYPTTLTCPSCGGAHCVFPGERMHRLEDASFAVLCLCGGYIPITGGKVTLPQGKAATPVVATLLMLLLCFPAFSAEPFRPYVYRVLSHEVVDGDTVRTELDLGFRIRVDYLARLNGLDAPELNTEAGKAVRDYIRAWCARQQTLTAVSVARDKYEGRYVAEIHGDSEQLNAVLLDKGLARPYDGQEKRKPWTESELETVRLKATESRLMLVFRLFRRQNQHR